jgi:hypothetical protein
VVPSVGVQGGMLSSGSNSGGSSTSTSGAKATPTSEGNKNIVAALGIVCAVLGGLVGLLI